MNGSSSAPTLSVIIASVNGPPMIVECLEALQAQRGAVDAEVIVVDVTGDQTVRLITERFPWAKVVPVAERRTIPQLRAMGLAQSRGEIAAIIEDHCMADPHWYEEIVKAHREHPECTAVGGAVENGSRDRLVDWAVFFTEYSAYMLPVPRGIATDIPGNNASYKRRAFEHLPGIDELLNRGFWESTLHPVLVARGDRLLSEPSIVVYHKKHFGFWYFVTQRYHFSRFYAGTLVTGTGVVRRAVRSVAALALPPVLLARIVGRVARKRRHLGQFLLTSPLLIVFTGVWAFGEVVGGLLGPGRSASAVE
jgi:GT2 family glycosyltransferase